MNRCFLVIMFVLGGAMLNVAVTWGCATLSRHNPPPLFGGIPLLDVHYDKGFPFATICFHDPVFGQDVVPMPYRVLWPGFAINTIIYAAILWVMFFLPGKVKRTLRSRRGLCPACAYPVGTSPVCTECGTALKRV
jgi:hypothetical protein